MTMISIMMVMHTLNRTESPKKRIKAKPRNFQKINKNKNKTTKSGNDNAIIYVKRRERNNSSIIMIMQDNNRTERDPLELTNEFKNMRSGAGGVK